MGTKYFLPLKTYLHFLHKCLLNMGFHRNMIEVLCSIWVFVCSSVLPLMGFTSRYIFRLQRIEKNNDYDNDSSQQEDQTGKLLLGSNANEFREKEVYFDFEKDEINGESKEENENSDSVDTALATSTKKYELISGEYIGGYIEEHKATSFIVQEFYLGSLDSRDSTISCDETFDTRVFAGPDFLEKNLKAENIDSGETQDSVESIDIPKVLENQNQERVVVKELSEIVDQPDETSAFWDFLDVQEQEMLGEDELSEMANDPEIMSLVKVDSMVHIKKSEDNYTSLSDAKSESISIMSSRGDQDTKSVTNELLGMQSFSAMYDDKVEDEEYFLLKHETKCSDDEFIELKPFIQNSSVMQPHVLAEEDSGEVMDRHEGEEIVHDSSGETGLQGKMNFSYKEDPKDLDFLWEDDDIIEQIKLELKNARTGGLPTIVEEEEDDDDDEELDSPMMVDDLKLKPLKIEMKFDYKHRMQEIQKVYKTYAEKMRKLDILNNQTLHAIGFLQLKEEMKSISSQQKSSLLTVRSLWSRKTQKSRINSEPMLKAVVNLYKDLEFVYVGQVCISWEILHWQYLKVQELQEYEAREFEFHQYNIFASEFQLFQVLLQRFVEDESYKGPRVQNYAKNRFVLPTLLQVPALRDDSMRDNNKLDMNRKDGSISIEKLSNFMTESLLTFWEFIRKDERSMGLKGAQHTVIDEAADFKLLMDIRKEFLKKDKRLRDIQRTGNCLVKKFQKPQGNRLEQELLVPEVELRMISRVLNMSTLTRDQLIWCHKKLKQIRFDNKKVHLEASFSLFPC